MRRRDRLTLCGVAVTVALLGAAAIFKVSPPTAHTRADAIQPVRTTYSLGEVASTREMIAPFTLRNRAGKRMRILGYDGHCGPRGCIDARGLPVDVPASGEAVVEIAVRTPAFAGPFRLSLTLFTDSPGQLRLPLYVEGSVRPAPDAREASPAPEPSL